MKKYNKRSKLFWPILIILLLVLGFAGYKVVSILLEYKEEIDYNDDIRNMVIISDDDYVPAGSPGVVTPETDADSDDASIVKPLIIDFEKLHKINKKCFGWLQIPNTDVSYPVVYTDDNSYYLRRALDGSKLSSGTLFADKRNKKFAEDDNTVIYGHHVQSGIMFAPLVKYKNQNFFDEHQYGYMITPEGNYRIDFFAGFITTPKDDVYSTALQTENRFNSFVERCISSSDFKTDIKPEYGEKLVTLSTCTYEFDDARYVVVGRIVKL